MNIVPGSFTRLKFDPGTIVVDDRAYNDYHLFAKWTSEGVYFVTRMKEKAISMLSKSESKARLRRFPQRSCSSDSV